MSDQRATARTSQLDRFLKTLGLFLVCVVGLSGCPKLLCDFGVTDLCETYTVTYFKNGADSGKVPVDLAEYEEGDSVTVEGNTGGLSLTGYSFAGWNTAENGEGTSYSSGESFKMASANVPLYAEWSGGEEEEEEEEEVLPDAYEPDGGGQATELIPDGRIQEGHTLHSTGTLYPVTTPEGTFYKGDEDNYYVEVSLDVFGEIAVAAHDRRVTLRIETYGDTPTFLSAYAPGIEDGIAYGERWISASIDNSGRYDVLVRHVDAYGGTGEYSISAMLEITYVAGN